MHEQDDFPHPVSEPEARGVPDYADDESTAYDDVETGREADGWDPAPVPGDRDDRPLGLDEWGTTAEEERRGEPLDGRLAREEPDVSPDGIAEPPEHVGRLVDPDDGGLFDTEADSVAYDAGAAGGAPSAEEAAMHDVEDEGWPTS